MSRKALLLYIVLAFFTFLAIPRQSLAASKIVFQDNFNDNDISDWTVTRNMQWSAQDRPCMDGTESANWQVLNGKIGIKISGPGCVTEIVPSDFMLKDNSNYVYSFDMEFTGSADSDRNVIFKYQDPLNWYDLKFNRTSMAIQKSIGNYYNIYFHNYTFEDNQTYHFDIELIDNKITIYIDNEKVWEFEDSEPFLNKATVGLQASVGANPNSEVWFDNIVVTSISSESEETLLGVPPLKQTSEPWKYQVYDSAEVWSPEDPTINAWGCAMTSAAMILQYYDIQNLPDGTALDPGSLNSWLKEQPDGYIRNGLTNWLAISRLSKLAKDNNPGFTYDALEYQRFAGEDKMQLTDDLKDSIPDILQEPGHFVVAKGVTDTSFAINDPYYDRESLTDYGDTFQSIGRFSPSHTDLSYFEFVIDKNIDVRVIDALGNPVGTQYLQEPLQNDTNPEQKSGDTLKVVLVPKPSTGTYHVTLSSPRDTTYQLDSYLYSEGGQVKTETQKGFLSFGNNDVFTIVFDKAHGTPGAIRDVTLTSMTADVNEAVALNQMDKALGNNVVALLKNAQKDVEKKHMFQAQMKLKTVGLLLQVKPAKQLSGDTLALLQEDLAALQENLQ